LTTSAPNELYLVLESFKPALRSIDLRCIAVSPPSEEYWQNLVTSVFLSAKTVDEVKAEQKTIPKIRNNNSFALFCNAVPFNSHVLEKIAEGELRIPVAPFGRIRIQFRKSDLFGLKVRSSREWKDGYPWLLKAVDSGLDEERKELWSIVDKQTILPTQFGFDNILKMIEYYLRISYHMNERKDIEVVIWPPATIENLGFKNNNLEVTLEKTSKLKGLQLNLSAMRENATIWRDIREIEFEKTEFRNNPEVFDTKKLLPLDFLDAKLIHRDSGLTLDEKHKRVPIKNVAEPFLKTLDSFCSLDEFEKMLFEPEHEKKTQDVFEDAVAWLLSLAGFDVIRLRLGMKSFDKLIVGEGYEKGCADIIAYEENERILLIECDTGPVDEIKVQKLAETKRYFREKLKGYEKLPIVPILFSPRDFRKSSPSTDVMIAHRSVIERIFEAVVQGNQEKARSLLYYSGF
jgi:hypothetical protein